VVDDVLWDVGPWLRPVVIVVVKLMPEKVRGFVVDRPHDRTDDGPPCRGRSPSIPSLVRLAEHTPDVARVRAIVWLPIPALLQQHPDGVGDPQRYRIRRLYGPISVLYLRNHREIVALVKGDLPRQNLCGDEISEQGGRAAKAYFVDYLFRSDFFILFIPSPTHGRQRWQRCRRRRRHLRSPRCDVVL